MDVRISIKRETVRKSPDWKYKEKAFTDVTLAVKGSRKFTHVKIAVVGAAPASEALLPLTVAVYAQK